MAHHNSKPISPECKALLGNFESFLYNHCRVNNRTAGLYIGVIRRAYPLIGAKPSHADLEAYTTLIRQDLQISDAYYSVVQRGIEHFAKFLGNPISLTRTRQRKLTPPITLTEAEIAILLHATRTLRQKAMMTVLAYSGIRNNEFCNLRVHDIDVPNGVLRVAVGKFNKQRTVAVTSECLGILEQYLVWRKSDAQAFGQPLQPDDFLFVTQTFHLPLEAQDVRKMVRSLAKRAGFTRRIWPHLMRHSLATNMCNRGAHLLTIRDQLGHVYAESTMVYVHRSAQAHTNDYRQYAPSYL